MHFSKTYTQLLLSLPPELRENAIEYRQVRWFPSLMKTYANPFGDSAQLKKLINQIVRELSSLGLSPAVLQELLESSKQEADERVASKGKGKAEPDDAADLDEEVMSAQAARRHGHVPRVVYEVTGESGRIEPQLRLWVDPPTPSTPDEVAGVIEESESSSRSERTIEGDLEDEDLPEEFGGPHMSLLWALQRRSMAAAEETAYTVEPSAAQIMEVPVPA